MIAENLSSTAKETPGNSEQADTASAAGGPGLAAPVSHEDVDALDGCDIEIVAETLDEDLPPTEGGVA